MNITQIPERIAYLILMYLCGELTASQRTELDDWIMESKEHQEVFDEASNLDL